MKEKQILGMFPGRIRERFRVIAKMADELQEIRLIAGGPVRVICSNKEYFLNVSGEFSSIIAGRCWYLSVGEMEQILERLK